MKRPTKPDIVTHDDYILIVGAVERRKNHALLAQVYKLAQEKSIDLPHLYIAGGISGWLVDDLIHRLSHDDYLKKKITLLGRVSDNELHWLYMNTRLVVFPSFYEGWGLPIAESLAYGKVTLSSDTSSMPEVGGQYADFFSPYSAESLLKLLVTYQDDKKLRKRAAQIKQGFKATSWGESLKQLQLNIDDCLKSNSAGVLK